MMSIGLLLYDISPFVYFSDIWPSPVTFIVRHFHFYHQMDVMLLCIGSKYEVCRFNKIWDMDNCLKTENWNDITMTSSPNRFLWNLNTNRPSVYLSDIPNFILIEHKRAEIQGSHKKHSENADTPTSVTFDLDTWLYLTYVANCFVPLYQVWYLWV